MQIRRRHLILATVLLSTGAAMAVLGNACSGPATGFAIKQEALSAATGDSTSLSSQTPTSLASKIPNDQYLYCYKNAPQIAGIPTCLQSRSVISADTAASLSAAITGCASETGHPTFLAVCIKNAGIVIQGYRLPMQSDFEKCMTAVGQAKIAGCLDKNGILPSTFAQKDIDACMPVGVAGVEKCLRGKGFLPRREVLTQFDVNLCSKVSGPTSLYVCLANSEILPMLDGAPQFASSDWDTCVTAAGATAVVKCLRKNVKISRVLLANHINRCLEIVPQASLAACLDANGLLPTVAGVAVDQNQLDSCIAARGVAGIATCLRWDLGALGHVLAQADIAECNRIYGTGGLAKCLSDNALLPQGLTQAAIDTCAAAVAVTSGATMTKCLRKNGYLSKALVQGDVNQCLKYVDATRTGNCLNANVASFAPLLQTDVDDCVTKVGEGSIGVSSSVY